MLSDFMKKVECAVFIIELLLSITCKCNALSSLITCKSEIFGERNFQSLAIGSVKFEVISGWHSEFNH